MVIQIRKHNLKDYFIKVQGLNSAPISLHNSVTTAASFYILANYLSSVKRARRRLLLSESSDSDANWHLC